MSSEDRLSSPEWGDLTEKDVIKIAQKELCRIRVGVIEAHLESPGKLPALPLGYSWAECDGSALSQQENPLAFHAFGSSLPSIPAGSALVQAGDLGYKILSPGETGRGAVLNAKSVFSRAGEDTNHLWSGGALASSSYNHPGIWEEQPIEEGESYWETYGQWPLETDTFPVPSLDFSLAKYDEAESGDSELCTPYQQEALGVIPSHCAAHFYAIIDEATPQQGDAA